MAFSKAQQGLFRPLVAAAWEKECQGDATAIKDKAAKDAWYRAELVTCIGKDSTIDANKGRDFDKAMAHFEQIARNDIKWTFNEHQGDLRRLLFNIHQICDEFDITDAYARATAAKILQWPGYLSSLDEIKNEEDLRKVQQALYIHAKRHAKKGQIKPFSSVEKKYAAIVDPDNVPF